MCQLRGVSSGINSAFRLTPQEVYCARDGSPAKIIRLDSAGKQQPGNLPLFTVDKALFDLPGRHSLQYQRNCKVHSVRSEVNRTVIQMEVW